MTRLLLRSRHRFTFRRHRYCCDRPEKRLASEAEVRALLAEWGAR